MDDEIPAGHGHRFIIIYFDNYWNGHSEALPRLLQYQYEMDTDVSLGPCVSIRTKCRGLLEQIVQFLMAF